MLCAFSFLYSRDNFAVFAVVCSPVLLLAQCGAVEGKLALALGQFHCAAVVALHAVVASVRKRE